MACQVGQTSQVHQSQYTFQLDELTYFNILVNNKNIINFLDKDGAIYQSLNLGPYLDSIELVSICTFTGDVIVVSDKDTIFMINYIPLIKQWVLVKNPVSSPFIKTRITALEFLKKKEILLCDMENVSIYKIQHNAEDGGLDIVRTWVKATPVSPVFNIIKHCTHTVNSAEYICSKFNLLTYNDSIVYVWKRTVIDVEEDIYSYQLSLTNTDKANSSTILWNKWSKINGLEVLYTLNEDYKMRVWHKRAEVVNLDLRDLGHNYLFAVKSGEDKDTVISFGFNENKSIDCSTHKIRYDKVENRFVIDTIDQPISFEKGKFLPRNWTKNDYLEFTVDERNRLIFVNNFDQQATAIVKYDLSLPDFTLKYVSAGNTFKQSLISSNSSDSNFCTQSTTNINEMTVWEQNDEFMHSSSHNIDCSEMIKKAVVLKNGEVTYLFSDKVIHNDKVISFTEATCNDISALDDKSLLLTYDNKIEVYDIQTFEKIISFEIADHARSFIHENNVMLVRREKSITNIVKCTLNDDYKMSTVTKSFLFELKTSVVYQDCINGMIALEDTEGEIIFYDTVEMMMIKKLTKSKEFGTDCWTLDPNGCLWLIAYKDDCIILYNNIETKEIKTKSRCRQLFTIKGTLVLIFDNYFDVIQMENLLSVKAQTKEGMIKSAMSIGDYTKVAQLLEILATSMKKDVVFDPKGVFIETNIITNKSLWQGTYSYLKVKLKDQYLITVLEFINGIVNNVYSTTTFFGLNYAYKASLNNIKLKDGVLAIFDKDFTIPENINFTRGYKGIFQSSEQIKADFDYICKSVYQDAKNPHDVGVYYLAMGKLTEYKLIWKYSTKKEADKVNNFLVNYNSKKCLNNGYKLLSLHRYWEACWFFLLGDDYKSCFYTILKKMHDFNLAVAVIKVLDETGEKLKECLQTYCLEYFKELNRFWEYFYSGLIINDFGMASVELDSFILEIEDLECLLMIVKEYGSDELELDVLRRIKRLALLSSDDELINYYTNKYKPQDKKPFFIKEQAKMEQPKTDLFSSFSKNPVVQEIPQVTSSEPKSMLDDWM